MSVAALVHQIDDYLGCAPTDVALAMSPPPPLDRDAIKAMWGKPRASDHPPHWICTDCGESIDPTDHWMPNGDCPMVCQ